MTHEEGVIFDEIKTTSDCGSVQKNKREVDPQPGAFFSTLFTIFVPTLQHRSSCSESYGCQPTQRTMSGTRSLLIRGFYGTAKVEATPQPWLDRHRSSGESRDLLRKPSVKNLQRPSVLRMKRKQERPPALWGFIS